MRRLRIDAETIVVDDGSVDATSEVAREILRGTPGRVVRIPENAGKGAAFRRGFAVAEGRWVLVSDADFSTPIEEYAQLAAAARDHDLDIVIGSRAMAGARIEKRQHPVRQGMGKAFNLAVRLATGLPFRDTQCGFKLFARERVEPLVAKLRVDGFAFDVELLFLAARFQLRVGEVPVVWRNDEHSSVGLVRDPLRMLLDLALVRWRFRRGLYNPEASERGVG